MTDPHDTPRPPGLDDDDVVESIEVVSGHDGIGTRREAREQALSLLFEAEQRSLSPLAEVLDQLAVAPEPFTRSLVEGVSKHQAEIDALLEHLSEAWPLDRMPAIDRALLRMGAYELAHTDVPVAAGISEAVELAKRYSTDDSHKFVNGMLAAVAAQVRPTSS